MAHETVLICLLAANYVFGISAQIQCQYERDEVAAGRQCQRACQPDGTCRKQNRECACDERCGPVCLKKACPPLSEPENGRVTINPRERFIHSEAVYSCIDGYDIVENNTRICHANKTWSGTVPICRQSSGSLMKTCRRLPSPFNGRDISQMGNGDVVIQGTVMRFACNEGFERTAGSLRRKCRQHGIWSGSDLVCSAVVDVQCSRNNQEIQNQNRRCLRQCESHSGCLRGRHCVCDDICGLSCILTDRADYCEHLPSDQSVRVVITPRNRTFGSIARYTCRNSYEGRGSEDRKCLGSGQWSGDPLRCFPRVRCHQPPEIANAAHNGTKAYYVEGDIVMYSCHYGYYRSGSLPLLRCDGDEWSDIQFQCSPRCPAIVNNGRYARILYHGSESNASTFQTGTMVEVVCAGGTVAEGATLSTCNLGRWDPPIGQCVHTDYSECGIAKNTVSRGRIVGGNNANPGAWPWQVYLDITRGNLQKSCGGVLIDRYWVLTTAACISNAPDYRITAVLGMTYLDRPRLQEIQIEEAVVHPNYSQTNVQNDIALLKLNRSAELNEFVRIVCLPDKTRANQLIPRNPSMRHVAIVTGWGLLNARNINDLSSRQPAAQLQQLAVPMKSREDCLRSLQGKPEFQFFDAGMFCAGYSNARRGPCIGDAGGPIIRKVAQNMQRRWVLIGLTSWGRGCAVPGELDFFTNVPYFMDWITESMRQVEAK